jgi:predicted HNH restriction endonuclease
MTDNEKIDNLSVEDFVKAFEAIKPTQRQWQMLNAHVSRPNYDISASEMAEAMGYQSFEAANSQYGTFARKFCEHFGLVLKTNLLVLVEFYKSQSNEFIWVLRPSVIRAIGLLRPSLIAQTVPPQVAVRDELAYLEGSKTQTLIERSLRSQAARLKCLEYHGLSCVACGFNFERCYGTAGYGFIEIHHLKGISSNNELREVDPINDLIPLCSNCHSIVHRREPMLSIFELKALLSNP